MSWQTKGRIEIYGQGGPCDRSRVEVSRSFPSMLAGYIEPQQFENFCIELDKLLEPMQKVKNLTFNLMIFMIVLVVLMFIWTLVQYANFDATDYSWDDNFWVWWMVIGGLIVFVPLFCSLRISQVTNQVKNELKRLCDAESNKYPQIQFQVRFEAVLLGGGGGYGHGRQPGFKTFNYIEIQMAPSALPQNPVQGQFPGIPVPMMATAPGMVGGVYGGTHLQVPTGVATTDAAGQSGEPKSAAQRLAELETLKPMLSPQEYAAKKAEILDSL